MSLIGDIVGAPAKLVEGVCDAVLPKELEWVGDVASMMTNIQNGNWIGVMEDVADLGENFKKGDFTAVKLKEGLGKLLAPEHHGVMSSLSDPDAPLPFNPDIIPKAIESMFAPERTVDEVPVSSSGGASAATAGAAPANATGFAKMNDREFMDMIRDGRIPPEISKDPAAMQSLQLRMQEIQQMNALMTNLMRAMHEMQMEIIRNVRA